MLEMKSIEITTEKQTP